MTLFDLLHESKLFNTGAEVRRYIYQRGVTDLETGESIKDKDHACIPERKYRIYLRKPFEVADLIAH